MTKKTWAAAVLAAIAAIGAGAGYFYWEAHRYATRDEAVQMVKSAVAEIKADQKGTFAAITAKEPKWRSKDLYPVVYGMSGEVYAHGQNGKQVGLNLMSLRDPDGKLFVKERVELASAKDSFWQEYKFTDPISRMAIQKEAYCEKLGGKLIVCAGVYKR